MKILIMLASILLITGCLPRAMQPPPTGYKSYQGRHPRINVEQIKQDMIACGFPDVQNENSYANNDEEGFVGSVICMEKKGYKSTGGRSICRSIYSETEACQKHLSETRNNKNQK